MCLKVGTACSGIEAPIQALKNLEINHDHLFSIEIDKYARKSILANYNPKELFEDIKTRRQLPKLDLYVCGFPCFTRGTLVLSHRGYLNIEDVTIDDKLLTHTGKFNGILNIQRKLYNEKFVSIDIKYRPHKIITTPEHPFYVRNKTKDKTFGVPEWKKAENLTLDDYFGIPLNTSSDIPSFSFIKKTHKFKTTTEEITLDKEEHWFTMGYFIGDGWIQGTKKTDGRHQSIIRFAVGNKDENEVVEIISKVLKIKDKKCDTGKCKKFGCTNSLWFNILKQFGKYSHGKKIPEWVQNAPINLIKKFIDGYIKSDGYYINNNEFSITTVSVDLAYGLQRLFLKIGIIVSVNKTIRPKTCVIQGRTVNQKDTFRISGYLRKKRNSSSFIENNYAWFAPRSINNIENNEETTVYNFEVENDNSYIVENTIVHNCQPFSTAGKRKGSEDLRGNIFKYAIGNIIDTDAETFVLENVKGIMSMDYWNYILEELEKLKSYRIYYRVLNTKDYGIPQNRERVYIIGVKDSKKEFKFPNHLKMKDIKSYVEEHGEYNDPPTKKEKVLEVIRNSKASFLNLGHLNFKENSFEDYSPCITALSPMWNVPKHRKATITELLSLQGFPKDFKQVVSYTQMKKQIGNSMSVNVLECLFKELFCAQCR